MRIRVALAVIVLAITFTPGIITAQTSEIAADVFGDGWSVEVSEQEDPPDGSWRKRIAFFGPNGNRALILIYDLGDSISDRSTDWSAVMNAFVIYSGGTAEQVAASDTTVPDGIESVTGDLSDTIRFGCLDAYGRECGTSAYAFAEYPVALIVRIDGTVNDLTGVAATDYIAGLYFAALNASQ